MGVYSNLEDFLADIESRMILLLGLCLLGVVHASPIISVGGCPEDWSYFQGNCYWKDTEQRNYKGASRICGRAHANLAFVSGAAESQFIADTFGKVWLGAKMAPNPEGGKPLFEWVDGSEY